MSADYPVFNFRMQRHDLTSPFRREHCQIHGHSDNINRIALLRNFQSQRRVGLWLYKSTGIKNDARLSFSVFWFKGNGSGFFYRDTAVSSQGLLCCRFWLIGRAIDRDPDRRQ
ncbi:hypothetical protein SDC9_182752 [bioreactor metagenome]|uniref:Uncharacterized protein n=1 Tax=bioreactor metagenome TaxID=1076179 RepID=A0A645H8E4_9ZZZZ